MQVFRTDAVQCDRGAHHCYRIRNRQTSASLRLHFPCYYFVVIENQLFLVFSEVFDYSD